MSFHDTYRLHIEKPENAGKTSDELQKTWSALAPAHNKLSRVKDDVKEVMAGIEEYINSNEKEINTNR